MAKAKKQAPVTPRFIARRPFDYNGKALDYGQVFEMAGAVNDEKLLRLEYVKLFDPVEHDTVICPGCGGEFIGHDAKIDHVRFRHQELTAAEEEELIDRREKKLETLAPINFANTIATRRQETYVS